MLKTRFLPQSRMAQVFLICIIAVGGTVLVGGITSNAGDADSTYSRLDVAWQREMLAQEIAADPRLDDDQLRAVQMPFDPGIQVQDFGSSNEFPLSGGGWRLYGGVIDVMKLGESVYVLYARQNQHWEAGLWDNKLDWPKSSVDLFLVRHGAGQKSILLHRVVETGSFAALLGLTHPGSERVTVTAHIDGVTVILADLP